MNQLEEILKFNLHGQIETIVLCLDIGQLVNKIQIRFFISAIGDDWSGYQLKITKNSHIIQSSNGGLYLTKAGTPGNSAIVLDNDNLLDYTEQGGNSAVPGAQV